MSKQENLLIVIDPTQSEQVALERAVITAQLRQPTPRLTLFVGVDEQAIDTGAGNSAVYRDAEWFTQLTEPLKNAGLEFNAEVCWSPQWAEAIIATAQKCEADLIIVPDNSVQQSRRRFTDTKWSLLRKAECPVLIVRPGASNQRQTVLAAVKMQDDNESYQTLNKKILNRGKWMADLYGAEFHVVNSYAGSMNYPDRGVITRMVDMDVQNIHVVQGQPDEAVAEVAKEINADIVVIGTLKRSGILAAMRGNTSEWVMSRIETDIMTLN